MAAEDVVAINPTSKTQLDNVVRSDACRLFVRTITLTLSCRPWMHRARAAQVAMWTNVVSAMALERPAIQPSPLPFRLRRIPILTAAFVRSRASSKTLLPSRSLRICFKSSKEECLFVGGSSGYTFSESPTPRVFEDRCRYDNGSHQIPREPNSVEKRDDTSMHSGSCRTREAACLWQWSL